MAANTFNPHGPDELTPEEARQITGAVGSDQAAEIIRQKLSKIYEQEPDATSELAEAEEQTHRSKHQEFMYKLGASGKDLATIQTEWHHYYESLPDDQKHTVWQEFYASQSSVGQQQIKAIKAGLGSQSTNPDKARSTKARTQKPKTKKPSIRDARSTKEVKAAIKDTVTAGGKLETKHHVQSLLFGLGMGLIVLIIFLFGFFNEVVIAPFVQPSRASASTPLIVSSTDIAPTAQNEVIIPKINVQIPVIYEQKSTLESDIENSLESGVVHYPTTAKPGELGNAAFFGHSSNNIFNKGKYKFAFVLLHTLVEGDTFYLTYNKKVYVYKVISKTVVEPTQVGVLGPVPGQTSTATLITCDPPGTSLRRMVIVGKQISPDPNNNSQSSAQSAASSTQANAASANSLPGNGPTLLGRFTSSLIGRLAIATVIVAIIVLAFRKFSKTKK